MAVAISWVDFVFDLRGGEGQFESNHLCFTRGECLKSAVLSVRFPAFIYPRGRTWRAEPSTVPTNQSRGQAYCRLLLRPEAPDILSRGTSSGDDRTGADVGTTGLPVPRTGAELQGF